MSRNTNHCPNMNHGRTNPPVRFCPNCGDIVNKNLRTQCNEQKHKASRKERSTFCQDCGQKLNP